MDAVLKLFAVMPAGESVNISTDNQVSIAELVERICDHFGYTGEIARLPARAADVRCHIASNAKAKSLIDYSLTPFDDGLARTLEWYRDRIGADA